MKIGINKEYERFERIGTLPFRSYYIPFDENDKISTKYGIINREKSSRFYCLDGIWDIKEHKNIEEASLEEVLEAKGI